MTTALEACTDCGHSAVLDILPQLVAQAAHDLNNHLATILGKSEIALMIDDPARWRRGLEESFEAGQQARVLVADLQRLVAWHQNGTDPVPAPDVLKMVGRLAARSLRRFGTELVVDAGGRISIDRPAPVATALWQLLCHGLETAGRGTRRWELAGVSSPFGWDIELATPGFEWPRSDANEVLRLVTRSVDAVGGSLELAGSLARFRFQD